MTVNYVLIRKAHFLPLMMIMAGHFLSKSEEFFFVTRGNVRKGFTDIGLRDIPGNIAIQTFAKHINGLRDQSINFFIHHSRLGVSDFREYVLPLLAGRNFTISFFADGFTNELDDQVLVREFLSEIGVAHRGCVLFFDVANNIKPDHLCKFRSVVVDSSVSLPLWAKGDIENLVTDAINRFGDFGECQDLLIIMPRDWGGDPGRRGQLFASQAAERTAELLQLAIGSVVPEGASPPYVVIRPDGRSPALMKNIMEYFSQKSDIEFKNSNDFWPESLNFDPFLLKIFSRAVDARIRPTLISFDSTVALLLIGMARPGRYIIGIPPLAFENLLAAEDLMGRFKRKISRLISHVENVSGRVDLKINRIDESYYIVEVF